MDPTMARPTSPHSAPLVSRAPHLPIGARTGNRSKLRYVAAHRAIDRRARKAANVWLAAGAVALGVVVPAGMAAAAKSPQTSASSNAVIAADNFSRVVSSGLGTADTGGAWKFVGSAPAKAAVNGTAANVAGVSAGGATSMSLPGATALDADVRFRVAVPTTPKTASGWYVAAESRRQADGRSYRGKLTFASGGVPRVSVYRVDAGGTETALGSANLTWSVNKGQLVYVEIKT